MWVLQSFLRPDSQEEDEEFVKITIAHMVHQILILKVIFTFMFVDVDLIETESENWNFLTYGRIGKHPMQSLPCDRHISDHQVNPECKSAVSRTVCHGVAI